MTATVPPDALFERLRIAGDPLADPAAMVIAGRARFTVLTARLVRMEYSPEGCFEDRSTYAFPNRRAAVPRFDLQQQGSRTAIDTGALRLTYTDDGRAFDAGNLTIELLDHPRTRWCPGQLASGNLGGARRTVDRCRGEAALELGLVSRDGWALIEDSDGIVFSAGGAWVEPRAHVQPAHDWYFFGYGHDYPAAVSEYTRFGGSIPLVPRWVLGAWWSRYWPYRDADVRELVEQFRARGFPLDVFVIDMDWHTADSWTGYTWNRELFPDPAGLLSWLHEQGLRVTLNLHPALGVQSFEDAYPAVAHALGIEPATRTAVPFRITDRDFVRAYFELVHHPLEDEGVDFWWMDWQQGRSSELAGLDPLPWLNHLHFQDIARRPGRRGVDFSRWGGLGSHRYPVGFSGDSYAQWSALQFQPRYTAAGANVAYSWWSHDIGGHAGADDPELYARWVQFGALSPVLRPHSNNHQWSERRPWMFGDEVTEVVRAAFEMRYRMIPYLYSAARVAADTGISIVRPMSWLAPENDSAYLARHQYLLGDSLLAAPAVHPADPTTGRARVDVWVPEGRWFERETGESFTGPRWVRLLAALRDVPQLVPEGAVLPLAEPAAHTGLLDPDHLLLSVFPGPAGTARVYEDAGDGLGYRDGRFAWTSVRAACLDGSNARVLVEPAVGAGEFTERERRVTVVWEHTHRPSEVHVDGEPSASWTYDSDRRRTIVEIGPRPRIEPLVVTVSAVGPLAAVGDDHDRALRTADLDHLLGADAGVPDLARLRPLAADHPGRADAIARAGGPFVHVYEHTAQDEARVLLGRVVVANASAEGAVVARASWTFARGSEVRTFPVEPVEVSGDAAVFAAPFAWDGSATPTRWSVGVEVEWNGLRLTHRHESRVLMPALGRWRGLIAEPDESPGIDEVLADLAATEPQLPWREWHQDPSEADAPDLTQLYIAPFGELVTTHRQHALVGYAATSIQVATERDVAIAYVSGSDVEVLVDGRPVGADVTGTGPRAFWQPDEQPRRTESFRLLPGQHNLLFVLHRSADIPWFDLYITAYVVDPGDGRPVLDVNPG
ncbi:MAG: DUF5110 domain-containing protein [Actinobacteria bacterium]|nr:DUF5110 domain-containing protein [Actinomycetota bacterium]